MAFESFSSDPVSPLCFLIWRNFTSNQLYIQTCGWISSFCLLWNDGVGERENLPAAPRTRTRTRTNTNSLRGLWRSGPVSSSSKPRSSHCTRRRGTIPAFMFHTYTHTENPMFTITGQEWKGATSCGRPEQVTQQVESFFVFKGLLVFFLVFFFFLEFRSMFII